MDTAALYSSNKRERRLKLFQLLGLILALLAYAGLCTVVFLYFSSPFVGILFILLTIMVILALDALTSRRRLAGMALSTRKLTDQAELFKRTFLSDNEVMLSSLEKNIAIIDEAHHIYSIDHEVSIEGRKTIISYTIRGTNSSSKPTNGIRYKMIGKMPVNLKEIDRFNVSVSDPDYDRSDMWEAETTGKEPYYLVVHAPFLPFKHSVSPGENFCLRLSLTWLNATIPSAGYLVFYTSNFRKGVDRYSSKVTFDLPPNDLRLYRVEFGSQDGSQSGSQSGSRGGSRGIDLHDEEPSFEDNPDDPKTFTWDKTSPDVAYVLVFTRDTSKLEDKMKKESN